MTISLALITTHISYSIKVLKKRGKYRNVYSIFLGGIYSNK